MKKPFLFFLCTALFLLLGCAQLTAFEPGEDLIVSEFWVERDPMVKQEQDEYPIPRETAVEYLLQEAQFVFSGMIYGFSFVYVPSDKIREVEEIFRVEPIAEIPWGDPHLSVMDTRSKGNRLYARIRYDIHEYQKPWIELWQTGSLHSAGGTGEADLFAGPGKKIVAMKNGIKQAIRTHLRARVFNKPKKITGEVLFSEPPHLYINAAGYFAKVRVKVKIEEIRPYSAY